MTAELDALEGEVAYARHRVQEDLANLRGPAVVSLKRDLTESADSIVTDLKDRLAANPIATLAIGAGVAWKLVHRPPVASLLVGYGLYSLWRTDPRSPSPVNQYAMQAVRAGGALADRAVQLAGDAKSAAADGLRAAQETAAQAADRTRSAASQWSDQAAQASGAVADALVQGAAGLRESAPQVVQAVQQAAQRDKDTYLLGFAAAALAAAIGIAAQRRVGSHSS